MNLGKCPICRGDVELFPSIEIDDFKRYDLKCNTEGCLLRFKEFNYDDRFQLISTFRQSQHLAGIKPDIVVKENNKLTEKQERSVNLLEKDKRPRKTIKKYKKKVKNPVIHYNRDGKGICGHKGELTDRIGKVTCGNCKNNNEFKTLKWVREP